MKKELKELAKVIYDWREISYAVQMEENEWYARLKTAFDALEALLEDEMDSESDPRDAPDFGTYPQSRPII